MSSHPAPMHLSVQTDIRRPLILSIGVAALVSAGFVATGLEVPLLTLACAAAFLFLIVEQDLRRMRIPNRITFPAFAAALLLHGANGDLQGVQFALLGAGLGLAILVVPYAVGFLGAGDVKAVMALGALLGARETATLLIWSGLLGGVAGIALIAWKGGLLDLCLRWGRSLVATVSLRKPVYFWPEPGSAAARAIPFGLVLGASAVAAQYWGAPWAL